MVAIPSTKRRDIIAIFWKPSPEEKLPLPLLPSSSSSGRGGGREHQTSHGRYNTQPDSWTSSCPSRPQSSLPYYTPQIHPPPPPHRPAAEIIRCQHLAEPSFVISMAELVGTMKKGARELGTRVIERGPGIRGRCGVSHCRHPPLSLATALGAWWWGPCEGNAHEMGDKFHDKSVRLRVRHLYRGGEGL